MLLLFLFGVWAVSVPHRETTVITHDRQVLESLETLETRVESLEQVKVEPGVQEHSVRAWISEQMAKFKPPARDGPQGLTEDKVEALIAKAVEVANQQQKDALAKALDNVRADVQLSVAAAVSAERDAHVEIHAADRSAWSAAIDAIPAPPPAGLGSDDVRALVKEILAAQPKPRTAPAPPVPPAAPASPGSIDSAAVRAIVDEMVLGDLVGQADWALNQAGAIVLPATSPPMFTTITDRTLADWLAMRRAVAMPAEVALSPDNTVGNCYAFARPEGRFVVRLAAPLERVTGITIDHVAASVAFDRTTAPKRVTVYAYGDAAAATEAHLLGEFEYLLDGRPVQTFSIPTVEGGSAPAVVRAVELRVLDNHGASFTCLYRFRVHGKAQKN